MDLQAFNGFILWKAEFIHRESVRKTITAFTLGGEYTFSNVKSTGIDIGLIAEYNFDDRGKESISGLDDDVFIDTWIALNDVQSSDLLGGIIVDMENKTQRYFGEINCRVGES